MAAKGKSGKQGKYLGNRIMVTHRYCAAKFPKPVRMAPGVSSGRARLIRENASKWLNGSTLRYWFFDKPAKWTAPESQKKVVRAAFKAWKALGIGLDFVEVKDRSAADLRIAFEIGDGAWSYIGTDVRTPRPDPRTMNFGWSLTDDPQEGMDTAIHEIGHTLGFPHEHQNPFAGIVWNEDAVYASLAGPPNNWSQSTTFHNIIEKIVADSVQGSDWDPDSVMHYPFDAGLIVKPVDYAGGLRPAGGLSARDKKWALEFYPGTAGTLRQLVPLQTSALKLKAGQQANFVFTPDKTRDYEFRTFGTADTVMALYETKASGPVLVVEDNDSGTERNAQFKVKLAKGKKYVVRVRLNFADAGGQTAVMVW